MTHDSIKRVIQIQSLQVWRVVKEVFREVLKAGTPVSQLEFLVEPEGLSRRGQLSEEETHLIRKELQHLGFEAILVWDCLPTEADFQVQKACFNRLFHSNFTAVRVQDFGVFHFLKAETSIHLVLETGSHNLAGVKLLIEASPEASPEASLEHLKRIVISNEVPMPQIKEWAAQLSVQLETSILGPLLVFYSPRPLLSSYFEKDGELQKMGLSGEDGRVFSFVENRHGTSMYLDKHLFLLDQLGFLHQSGITHGRINLEGKHSTLPLEDWVKGLIFDEFSVKKVASLKNSMTCPLTRGFISSNKTDRQFQKLKNTRLRAYLPGCCAKVLETVKKKYHILEIMKKIEVGKPYLFLTPDGIQRIETFQWLQKPWGMNAEHTGDHGTWLCSHVPGVSSGTIILEYENPTEV